MEINKLKVNHIEKPIGFMMDKPVFSWVVDKSTGRKQKEAQLLISTDDRFEEIVYDSGIRSDINSLGTQVDIVLLPCTRYYWKVLVRADDGEMGTSEPSWFEMGKMKNPWEGKWITSTLPDDGHPTFVKEFVIDKDIKSARAYVSGLGLYELEINGKKVGDEYLTPFFNDYNYWIQYQTYDITDELIKGKNVIGSILGNGWYKGRFGFIDKLDKLYGDRFIFICDIKIQFTDNSTMSIGTDESWKCHDSAIVESSIYDGEVYDAKRIPLTWSNERLYPAAYADIPKGKLVERLSPQVKITEKVKPVKLLKTPANEMVIDFGQIITGWVEFFCHLENGQEIKLQFGEILQENNFYNENLRTAKQEFRYISDGNKAHVRPHFTFYGFRYVKITGVEKIDLNDFTGCVLHTDIEITGNIETSNEKVNKLFKNALWGQRGNFLDVPTDCPQRDERMGWTGDAQIFAATASFNMYTPGFYTKYLYDMYLEQQELNGSVPFVVPDVLTQIMKITGQTEKIQHGSCAWSDAATIIPWTIYLFYGDKSLLKKQYSNMKKWADFVKKQDERYCGGKRLWQHGFHFADWLALDNIDTKSSFGGTDPYYVASAYYYYSVYLTAKAAKVLGYEDDHNYYMNLSREIKEAIRNEYFTPTGRIAIDTQTAMVLALYMGFVPQEFKKRLIHDLEKKLQKNNMHLNTGFVGTPYLCPVLSENDLQKHAFTLLLNEDYPSWLYEVNMGATTIWERWNSVLPNGLVSDTGMNSMNHYAYGCVVEWMYRYMSGINPVEDVPGFKKAIIKPMSDERFEWVKTRYESASGTYISEWSIKEDRILYRIVIPFDCEAEFVPAKNGKEAFVNGKAYPELISEEKITLISGEYDILIRF